MIYLFTWNSIFLLEKQVNFWKQWFIQKNGDFDLLHLKDLSQVSSDFLISNLTWASFFDKKLIIIDNFPLSISEKSDSLKEKQDFLETILEKIPENNIVLFNSINPDKRTKFFKKISSLVTQTKEFNISDENDLNSFLKQKYDNQIDNQAISLLVKYKSKNTEKIINEIDKLLITRDYIEQKDILENIFPEIEESIFLFIDDLLNLNIKNALEKMANILEQTNIYAFYNNLLVNIRTQVFITELKQKKVKISEITQILKLWNKWFLASKNLKIDFEKLKDFYINLINLDKKMKSWKMIASDDDIFILELEKLILKLK